MNCGFADANPFNNSFLCKHYWRSFNHIFMNFWDFITFCDWIKLCIGTTLQKNVGQIRQNNSNTPFFRTVLFRIFTTVKHLKIFYWLTESGDNVLFNLCKRRHSLENIRNRVLFKLKNSCRDGVHEINIKFYIADKLHYFTDFHRKRNLTNQLAKFRKLIQE